MDKMWSMKIITNNQKETYGFAKEFASQIKDGAILGLVGPLGAGKTVFVQGLAEGLGIKEKIKSPTFILMRNHGNFYHIDCYRLAGSQELKELGVKEIMNNKKNIVVIEWADKIRGILPEDVIIIEIKYLGKNQREICHKNHL